MSEKKLYKCRALEVSFLNNITLKFVTNNIEYVWQLRGFFKIIFYFLFSNTFYFYCNLFCYLLTYLFTYLLFYFLLCINVVNLLPIKNKVALHLDHQWEVYEQERIIRMQS